MRLVACAGVLLAAFYVILAMGFPYAATVVWAVAATATCIVAIFESR